MVLIQSCDPQSLNLAVLLRCARPGDLLPVQHWFCSLQQKSSKWLRLTLFTRPCVDVRSFCHAGVRFPPHFVLPLPSQDCRNTV